MFLEVYSKVLSMVVNQWILDSSKIIAVLLFIAILISLLIFQRVTRIKFKEKQLEYPRVRQAMEDKDLKLCGLFTDREIKYSPQNIFIRVFKEEEIVELWARSKRNDSFTFITDYRISCSSGILGPKREEGDRQVPEGFYYIVRFNPLSKYFLSLGINYPNESDCILGVRGKLGGDIFIHGGNKTIGCIPVTDDSIKELYLAAVYAVTNGQDRIPVHIFPGRLDDENFDRLRAKYKDNRCLLNFWENLKKGFDAFNKTHYLPKIMVGRDGKYIYR